jgi:flagellum-specific ATP synthase
VLSRALAQRNHYPAIDVLQSISRTMPDVTTKEHRNKAGQVRDWLSTIRDTEDLVTVGAYVHGANQRVDAALDRREPLRDFLCQRADTLCGFADALSALDAL